MKARMSIEWRKGGTHVFKCCSSRWRRPLTESRGFVWLWDDEGHLSDNTRHRLHITPKQKRRSDKPPYAKRKSSAPTPTNHPLRSCSPNMGTKVRMGHTRE